MKAVLYFSFVFKFVNIDAYFIALKDLSEEKKKWFYLTMTKIERENEKLWMNSCNTNWIIQSV